MIIALPGLILQVDWPSMMGGIPLNGGMRQVNLLSILGMIRVGTSLKVP